MRRTEDHRGPALRVTRLELENWKNFERADVELQRRAFFVGPNASGKSNLLDAIRFLHDIAIGGGGGFKAAIQTKREGVSSIRCLAARRQPDIAIRVNIGTDDEPRKWRYELRFYQDNLRRPFIREERVYSGERCVLDRPRPEDKEDPERLTQTFLEQVNVNQAFREVPEFLGSVNYLHIVPQLVREPDRSVGKKDDPFGGDFLEQVAGTPTNIQTARLRKIVDALRVAVPQLKNLELKRDEKRGTPHLRGKYEHWRAEGAWQSEEQFSDGTLRLMGLLWAILSGSGPLLLEEPELSLHGAVVRLIPPVFNRIQARIGRQVLISTHSADLLSDQGIGLDEVFLLVPGNEGTHLRPATEIVELKELVRSGVQLGEAVLPLTSPSRAQQLLMFGD